MGRKKSFLILLIIFSLLFSFVVPINKSLGVTSISVKVSPNIVTLAAEYRISFVTGKTLKGSAGDWVRIDFPNNFLLPCNCGGTGWSPSDFIINGVSPTYKPEGSNTDNQKHVEIELPSGLVIGAGEKVNIIIKASAKVKNPPEPGEYKLGIYTSQESTEFYSPPFKIVYSHVKNVVASLSSDIIGTSTAVAVSFTTGELGDLAGADDPNRIADTISLVLPSGFKVPSFISSDEINIRVNGSNNTPKKTSVKGNTIVCTVPKDIPANTQVTVEVSEQAGIVNPDTPGLYKIKVHTSKEKDDVESNAIEIKDKPYVRTKFIVTPSFPDGKNDFYITQPIVILVGETNTGDPITTYYKIDDGNYVTSVSGAQIVVDYGVHKISYYSTAGNIVEKVHTQVIKFDNAAPVLTINSPQSGSYAKSSECTITGSVKDDYLDKLLINGNKVEVLSDGSFSYKVNLNPGKNVFKILAEDMAGNKTERDISVIYDTTVPKISLASPQNWQEFKEPDVTVSGTVSPPEHIKLTINGNPVDVMADGSFTYSIMLEKPGMYAIKVVAEYEFSGKKAEQDVVIIYKPVKKITVLLKIGSKVITIDGKQKVMDVAPYIEPSTGRTLVPIRFISEAFGADVEWEPEFKVVTIRLNDTVIKLQVGNSMAIVNGSKVQLDQPPVIKDNRTMVPLRFISEAFGATVEWFPDTREVKIVYEED